MLQIFNRRRVSDNPRIRKPRPANTDRYRNRCHIDDLRVGNIGKNKRLWKHEERDVLLEDLTHREVCLELFRRFGVKRSRGAVRTQCLIINRILSGEKLKRKYTDLREFVKSRKLTKKNFRPFNELHMYGPRYADKNR